VLRVTTKVAATCESCPPIDVRLWYREGWSTLRSKIQRKPKGISSGARTVARQQQAKSWELRATMSMARLWRD
jgi:hypothetical protein